MERDYLDSIAKECNLFEEGNVDLSVQKILALDEIYERDNLVEIYNYFLTLSKTPEILIAVIQCSDRIRDKSTLSYLLDWLLLKNVDTEKDSFVNVRVMCAKAIANFKDTSAVTPLLYCLNNKDEHYKVKLSCAEALGKIGDRYAVLPLMNILEDESESSVYVKESAASALGLLGDVRAVEPLVNILNSNKGLLNRFTSLKRSNSSKARLLIKR